MIRVMLESPYQGDIELNERYALECLAHSIDYDEAPLASHLLYTRVLDDNNPKDRETGLQIAYEWMAVADIVAFYIDYGWSPGMIKALRVARLLNKKIAIRKLFARAQPKETLAVRELIEHCEAAGLVVGDMT